MRNVMRFLMMLLFVLSAPFARAEQNDAPYAEQRKQAEKLYCEGHYKEAEAVFRTFVFKADVSSESVRTDVSHLVACLKELDRAEECDALLEQLVAVHADNWQVLVSVAGATLNRSAKWGSHDTLDDNWRGGFAEDSWGYERVDLMFWDAASLAVMKRGTVQEQVDVLLGYAEDIGLWSQVDYEFLRECKKMVSNEDQQLFQDLIPEVFSRDEFMSLWGLGQKILSLDPSRQREINLLVADYVAVALSDWGLRSFLNQRDVQILTPREKFVEGLADDEDLWHTRKLKLPPKLAYIDIYKKYGAWEKVVDCYLNRRRTADAVAYLKSVGEAGANRLETLIEPGIEFGGFSSQPAGCPAQIKLCCRNVSEVKLEACRIDAGRFLKHLEASYKDCTEAPCWSARLDQAVEEEVLRIDDNSSELETSWSVHLDPVPKYEWKTQEISTPFKDAGLYWVRATYEGSKPIHSFLWINDLALISTEEFTKKSSALGFYVLDVQSGAPIADAEVDLTVWGGTSQKGDHPDLYTYEKRQWTFKTDSDGRLNTSAVQDWLDSKSAAESRWFVKTADGRSGWHCPGSRERRLSRSVLEKQQQLILDRVFIAMDRPCYRPGQTVKFAGWLRNRSVDVEKTTDYEGRKLRVIVGKEDAYDEELELSTSGRFEGELVLTEAMQLGKYTISAGGSWTTTGRASFRLEEYKKPEFDVLVSGPDYPVKQGEKAKVTVSANYYFGKPVAGAVVKVWVTKRLHRPDLGNLLQWECHFDMAEPWGTEFDYPWLGQKERGLFDADESIYDSLTDPFSEKRELVLDETGCATFEIDTTPGYKDAILSPDHRYVIQAQVMDASRRQCSGSGNFLAVSPDFRITLLPNRGFYELGEPIEVQCVAKSYSGVPVHGRATLRLDHITYDQVGVPSAETVATRDVTLEEYGTAKTLWTVTEAGQYRLHCEVQSEDGKLIEQGRVIIVRDEGFDGRNCRFKPIELIADKEAYVPGETARLLVNANAENATVLLFLSSDYDLNATSQVIRIEGRSAVVPVDISCRDYSKVIAEAATVHDGRIYRCSTHLNVPPKDKVLDVSVSAGAETYGPRDEVQVDVQTVDWRGRPVEADIVLAVYDAALDMFSSELWHQRLYWSDADRTDLKKLENHFWHNNLALKSGWDWDLRSNLYRSSGAFSFPEKELDAEPDDSFPVYDSEWGTSFETEYFFPHFDSRRGISYDMCMETLPSREFSLEEVGASNQTVPSMMLRKEFMDTAFWNASMKTDSNGVARTSFVLPDNVGRWKVRVWAMGEAMVAGEAETEFACAKDLLLRMQGPRFFIEGDEVVLSANVHNGSDQSRDVVVSIELDGSQLQLLDNISQAVTVAAESDLRVDWRIKARQQGEAVIRMKAVADDGSDAVQMSYPVLVHGAEKVVSFSGVVPADEQTAKCTWSVPEERRKETTSLTVHWSPTPAGALLDALPYLSKYPYTCSEQTLSRFVPAMLTHKVLSDLKLDFSDRLKEKDLKRSISSGLDRITSMQCGDGGWGWFSSSADNSSAHITAYVVHNLQKVEKIDPDILPFSLDYSIEWLANYEKQQLKYIADEKHSKKHINDLDAFVFMMLTDAVQVNEDAKNQSHRDRDEEWVINPHLSVKVHEQMKTLLYQNRKKLSVHGLCLLGLAMDALGDTEKRDMLVRNIEQYLVQEPENETAWLNLNNDDYWWCWYGDEIETMAYYLKLLCRLDPKSEKASGIVRYLLNNRQNNTYWKSTRDTAICIESIGEYIAANGAEAPNMLVEVLIDGDVKQQAQVNAQNFLTVDGALVLEGDELSTGDHTVSIRKKGNGALHYNACLSYFSLEKFIVKAGVEVKVTRNYFKMVEDKRVPIAHLGEVTSGDLIEVELELESKNDYEYILVTDPKPAGFEPVEVRSGYGGKGLRAYIEYRDEKVCFFISRLARGKHRTAYRMRAEIPGTFSALPAQISAMYAPELRGNSDEWKVNIKD